MKPPTPLLVVMLCALVGRWREGMHKQICAAKRLGLVGIDNRLTHLGGETLAATLLRDFAGPVVVVRPEQLPMFADEARIALDVLAGRNPYEARDVERWQRSRWRAGVRVAELIGGMRRRGWVRRTPRGLMLDVSGRAALAAWLLRGWRP